MTARLVELRIRGLRTLADVTLQLGGLTVLIGDNGTGKSSILEALRIARLVVARDFMSAVSREHVLAPAVRKDASEIKFDLRVETGSRNFVYALSFDPTTRLITHESIHELGPGIDIRSAATSPDLRPVIIRDANKYAGAVSIFEYFGVASDVEGMGVVREALAGIDVHLPFQVTSGWATRSVGRAGPTRTGSYAAGLR
jgi:hypothetical protein